MLCGLACGGSTDPLRAWLDQIAPAADPDAVQSAPVESELAALGRHTLSQIRGSGIGFDLLLPDDSRPLAERATALYDWVRGFLFAFGVLGISPTEASEQTREVLRDFSELTRLDLDDLDESEENEQALAELREHIWVAALLVYEEYGASDRTGEPKAAEEGA